VPFPSRFTRDLREESSDATGTLTAVQPIARNGADPEPDATTTHRLSNEHAALARDINDLATSLGEIDSRSSGRLRDLAAAINTPSDRSRWNAVDLPQAFNTQRLSQEYALRKVGEQRVKLIELADKARNALVLVPVFLTWYALAEASRNYAAYITENPDEAGQPFLLLWQQGFGKDSFLHPTFSQVALIDAAVIFVIIVLTIYAHGRREDQEDAVANVAADFYSTFDNILAEAGVLLARDRAAQPSQLARNVAALTDRFDQNSRELVSLIDDERRRIHDLANQRHEEFEDFALFARSMRAGAEQSNRTLAELRQLSRSLDESVDRLGQDVASTGRHQATLLSTLQNLEQLTSSAIQSDQAVTHRLAEAAAAISESADAAMSGAENANRIAEASNQALRGIGELAQRLSDTSQELATAMSRDTTSTQDIASALTATARQNERIVESLNALATDIGEIRAGFGDLANRTAAQARTLNGLLEQQTGIAQEITRATKELGAAGMTTAQRNREAKEDFARLAQRLEQLTTSLNRAAQQVPTVDTLQRAFSAALRTGPEPERPAFEEDRAARRWTR
jgi:methyl-accepting chemotaxis protein